MDAHDQRREALARLLAAALMGLVNDPTGSKLPEDCWRQMLPKADAVLFIATNGRTPYDPINAGQADTTLNAIAKTFRVEHIGSATLYCGDCREILPALSGIDAVVTDPPYGVDLGEHLGAKDGRKDHVLVKGAYASYEDTPDNFSNVVVPAIRQAIAMAKRSLVFCAGHNAWLLPQPDVVGGVYLPAARGRNKWGYASLAHCLLYGQAPDLHLGAKHTAYRSTESAPKVAHPCPKPDGWMAWAVDLASRKGEVVLDPFAGSGSTGVAAARQGRRFVGIEIDPAYFDLACQRIEQAQRQGDLFIAQPESAGATEGLI